MTSFGQPVTTRCVEALGPSTHTPSLCIRPVANQARTWPAIGASELKAARRCVDPPLIGHLTLQDSLLLGTVLEQPGAILPTGGKRVADSPRSFTRSLTSASAAKITSRTRRSVPVSNAQDRGTALDCAQPPCAVGGCPVSPRSEAPVLRDDPTHRSVIAHP